ncbi:Alpha-1,6-mannosylglycoprotein 6-beta-N-acetylglucosaminyltransferase A [Geodia barretti]|uniref:alpha-1,6-mannosyl-glycoprotein 6-beta-N-acetylglucosaminyltransferase n=1 Tax=Geodia barretti TaxID=519541 RepID=A0AA35SZ66_GEOBA|nr:Alpha-1,6-mannosylglycoprotein 6-beta-N-acetylglucosaminyltransferase A [Geodia barretti]
MAFLRCLSRSRRRCMVLSLAAVVTWFCFSLLSVPTDDGGQPWLAGQGRTVKLVRAEGSHRNILDVGDASKGDVEVRQGKEEEVEVMVTTVDVSTSQPSPPSVPESSRDSECNGPWPGYPDCGEKIQWMMERWESEECYAEHGVDGTRCSMQIYLSEVEQFCPYLPEREGYINDLASKRPAATPRFEVDGLLKELGGNSKFDWICHRIQRMWPEWYQALHTLQAQKPFSHATTNVLIHIGALTDKAGFHFAENAGKGGPLGELVQWSDLIASLYALGYNIDFSTEIAQLKSSLVVNNRGGCPSVSETKYTAIFVDIVGLKQLKKLTKNRFQMYKCLLRVLDTFGTEPVFNYKKWKPEKDDHNHDYGHTWGNWELNPRQFWTMYRKHLIVLCSLWSHFTPSFPSYISLLPFFYILPLFLYPSSLCFSLPHSHPVKFYSWSLSFTHTCSLTCISRLR